MNEDQPVRPANIANIVAINQGHRPLTMDEPRAPAIDATGLAAGVDEGWMVVDTRSTAAFGAGHVPGSYNLQLTSSEFEQRVGWIVAPEIPMILVLEGEELIGDALRKLVFVGLDSRVQGYLGGGFRSWLGAGRPHATLEQISVHQLQAALAQANGNGANMLALDVREPAEWDVGHIEGAHMMSFKVLEAGLDGVGVKRDDQVSVLCASGVHSSAACSILLRHGYRHVHNVTGGMGAWTAAKLPMVDAAGRALGGDG